jgi:hypothetical protein
MCNAVPLDGSIYVGRCLHWTKFHLGVDEHGHLVEMFSTYACCCCLQHQLFIWLPQRWTVQLTTGEMGAHTLYTFYGMPWDVVVHNSISRSSVHASLSGHQLALLCQHVV